MILKNFPFTPEMLENNLEFNITYLLHFNILIYNLDFYLVSASTKPSFEKLRFRLSEKVSFSWAVFKFSFFMHF